MARRPPTSSAHRPPPRRWPQTTNTGERSGRAAAATTASAILLARSARGSSGSRASAKRPLASSNDLTGDEDRSRPRRRIGGTGHGHRRSYRATIVGDRPTAGDGAGVAGLTEHADRRPVTGPASSRRGRGRSAGAGGRGWAPWGTTVAHLAAHNGPTTLWAPRSGHGRRRSTRGHGRNHRYLADYPLHPGLVGHRRIWWRRWPTPISSCSASRRGPSGQTCETVAPTISVRGCRWSAWPRASSPRPALRMTEIVEEVLADRPVGVLSGPNLAKEIMAGSRPGRWSPCPSSTSPAASRTSSPPRSSGCSATTTSSAACWAGPSRTCTPSPPVPSRAEPSATTPGRDHHPGPGRADRPGNEDGRRATDPGRVGRGRGSAGHLHQPPEPELVGRPAAR